MLLVVRRSAAHRRPARASARSDAPVAAPREVPAQRRPADDADELGADRRPLRSDRAVRPSRPSSRWWSRSRSWRLPRDPDGRVHVVALDVGQGDAILVETPGGGRLLVDGGPDPDRLLVALDARIPPWDRRIDLVVLTHPHEDHVAGLPLLVERYRVGRFAGAGDAGTGSRVRGARGGAGAPRRAHAGSSTTGDRFALDDVAFRVLWPDRTAVPRAPPDTGTGINNVSIVLLGTFGAQRFLLTGDAEEGIDPLLVARGLPTVDVLKVAHHGSRTATTDALLERDPSDRGAHLGRGDEHVRPSGAGDPRAADGPRRRDVPDGSRRDPRRRARRAVAQRPLRAWPRARAARRTAIGPRPAVAGSCRPARRRAASPGGRRSRPRPRPAPRSRMIGRMSVPGRVDAAALLLSLQPPAWHLRHVRAVAEVAGWLALRAVAAGRPVDRALVEAAALLHDVDKILPRGRPGPGASPTARARAAWLTARGHAELAAAVTGHPVTRLAADDADAWLDRATGEELLVAYADKRAGQRLVPMAGRFADWTRRYPESADWHGWSGPEAAAVRRRAERIESAACALAGVAPAAVRRLAWTGRALAVAGLGHRGPRVDRPGRSR